MRFTITSAAVFVTAGVLLWNARSESSTPALLAAAHQSVAIDLRTHDGAASLHAFALPGVQFRLDPSKLSFKARPFDKPHAAQQPLDVTIGAPVLVPPEGAPLNGRLVEYALPVTFHPSQPPGVYRVHLDATPGFCSESRWS